MVPALLLLLSDAAPPGAHAWEGPDLTRYFVVCGVLVVAVSAVGLFLRRFLTGTLKRRAALRSLQVLDVLPLGGRQRLVVVRCYDRSFLLGQGEKEVLAIAELDLEEPGEAPKAGRREKTGGVPGEEPAPLPAEAFGELLRRAQPALRRDRSLEPGGILG